MPHSVPNYLTINSDGTVSAVFTGGVILTEGSVGVPTDRAAVSWYQTGTRGGYVYVGRGATGTTDIMNIFTGGRGQQAQIEEQAATGLGFEQATLELNAVPGDATKTNVLARTTDASGSTIKQICVIQGDGKSSFPKIAGQGGGYDRNRVGMAFVIITGTGAVFASVPTGLIVVRNGVGLYTVSGLPTSTLGWSAVVTGVNLGAVSATNINVSTNSVQYQMFNTATGAAIDWEHTAILWSIMNE